MLIFPGIWLYGAYAYNFERPYSFYNRTSSLNETLPVTCLCGRYSACGCEENDDSEYLSAIIGDGNYANLNRTLVNVASVNDTKSIVLNGTLPNGTDTESTGTGARAHGMLLQASGIWVVGGIVAATVWLL